MIARAAFERRFRLVVSPQLLAELRDVLGRPKFDRWSGDGRAAAYVDGIAAVADMFDDVVEPPPVTRDHDDDYLVALAELSNADVIVSVDLDLLDQEGLNSKTPAEFLARSSPV